VRVLLAAAAVLVLGGCTLTPDAAQRAPAPSTAATAPSAARSSAAGSLSAPASPSAAAQRTHEVPTPVPPPTVAGGWHSPAEAVQEFATAYVNWNYRTVSPRLRALSEVSVGQARSMLAMAAAQVGHDGELRRGQIANSGVVEAVGPVRGRSDQYAVVTRERTTAANTNAYQGLAPAWHVALATVSQVRGLWVLSAWQPES
jgi:hypothetical protein